MESFDAGTEPSTFGEARGDPLQSARDSSLQEEGVVADLSEAEREAVEAREGVLESVWRMNVSSPRYAPRTSVPKELTFTILTKYIDVVRQTETYLDNLEECIIDDVWTGSTRFCILNQRPPKGRSWVDGRLTKIHVTSITETIWPEVWSSLSKGAEKKTKQQW